MRGTVERLDPRTVNDTVLRLAAAAYLGRYTGVSRTHSESALRIFFTWCHERELAPLAARRAQIDQPPFDRLRAFDC